jgi:hypothetical protein
MNQQRPDTQDRTGRRRYAVAVAMIAIIALAVLLREHWGHVLGVAPYLLLLACPLMHLFHGHGGHKSDGRDTHRTH